MKRWVTRHTRLRTLTLSSLRCRKRVVSTAIIECMLQASREQLDALQQALQATVTEAATKEADLRRQLDEARASAEARARESIGEAYLQLESLRQSLARAQDDAQHAAEAHAAELARLRASHVAEIATLRADMEAQAARQQAIPSTAIGK